MRALASVVALAVAGSGVLLGASAAGAATLACTRQPINLHCVGIESNQPLRLELTAHGPGNVVTAEIPAFRKAQDWDISPGQDNQVSRIRWAPRGIRSGLCLTAVSDVAGSNVRLLQCQHGTAGSSHQLWRHLDHGLTDYNYRNVANGLVLTVHGDFSGAPVQVRSDHLNSGARVFTCIGHSPSQTGP